jgi:hypothetical protein
MGALARNGGGRRFLHRCIRDGGLHKATPAATKAEGICHDEPMKEVDLPLTFTRDVAGAGMTRQQHAAAVTLGREVRVSRGAYASERDWSALDAREQALVRTRAVAETRRNRPILSHWSAALVHGMPLVGGLPAKVHVTLGKDSGGRSRGGVTRHSALVDDFIEIDGMLVTTVARTVLDMAVASPRLTSVSIVDFALRRDRRTRLPPVVTPAELRDEWELRLPFRGHARAREVIEFGSSKADTPLESVSRVTMHRAGFPQPLLQVAYCDEGGFIAETDFSWPDYRLVGEADGDIKYLDPAYRGGRSADRVVLDEKIREDRLRAIQLRVARWRWAVALSQAQLTHTLASHSLPTGVAWGPNHEGHAW